MDCAAVRGQRGISSLDWEILGDEPLVCMVGRNGLLRRGNKVLVVLRIAIDYLVKLFVKIFELGCLGHEVLQHELGSLERAISSLREELQTVVDQGLVEEDAPLTQEISSVADNLGSTVRIISIKTEKNLVMRENILLLNSDAFGGPFSLNGIVILYSKFRSLYLESSNSTAIPRCC